LLREGRLSVGHSKAILGLESPAEQESLARRVVAAGLTVRQTEDAAAKGSGGVKAGKGTPAPGATGGPRDLHVVDLENRIREKFGMKVGLHYKAGKGRLEVHFHSDDELDRVLGVIGVDAG
jgi:ParB family chromosome partitioning protein